MQSDWLGDPDGAVIGGPDGAILSVGTGAITFTDAEVAIRAHIVSQWAQSVYSAIPILWENETPAELFDTFLYVAIESIYAQKSIYGSAGLRYSVEQGIVFVHAFVPIDIGKNLPNALVNVLCAGLELQVIPTGINMDGANGPSPADPGDVLIPGMQPGGNYYRVSGSVPFAVLSLV